MLGNVVIKSFSIQWIQKLKSPWLISEIDDERVLWDEVDWVRDVDE